MEFVDDLNALRKQLAPVYAHYSGQYQPQPAYIEIDMEKETIEADWSGEVGGGVPMRVWHGLVRRISIPAAAKGNKIADFLESDDFRSLAQRMFDGFDTKWDGNNWVGTMTKDAQRAESDLERAAEEHFDPTELAMVWSVGEWLDSVRHEDPNACTVVLEHVGTIRADSTDEELQAIAEKISEDAAADDVYLEDDEVEWLEEQRDICIKLKEEKDEEEEAE